MEWRGTQIEMSEGIPIQSSFSRSHHPSSLSSSGAPTVLMDSVYLLEFRIVILSSMNWWKGNKARMLLENTSCQWWCLCKLHDIAGKFNLLIYISLNVCNWAAVDYPALALFGGEISRFSDSKSLEILWYIRAQMLTSVPVYSNRCSADIYGIKNIEFELSASPKIQFF